MSFHLKSQTQSISPTTARGSVMVGNRRYLKSFNPKAETIASECAG